MYSIVSGSLEDSSGSLLLGLTTLLGAGGIALALATGAVLNDLLAAPLDRQVVAQREARRR